MAADMAQAPLGFILFLEILVLRTARSLSCGVKGWFKLLRYGSRSGTTVLREQVRR